MCIKTTALLISAAFCIWVLLAAIAHRRFTGRTAAVLIGFTACGYSVLLAEPLSAFAMAVCNVLLFRHASKENFGENGWLVLVLIALAGGAIGDQYLGPIDGGQDGEMVEVEFTVDS